jgi:hypothetical protein
VIPTGGGAESGAPDVGNLPAGLPDNLAVLWPSLTEDARQELLRLLDGQP